MPGTADLFSEAADGRLHIEGGVARPHRMVLVSQRRPEQRHDPVAHDLVHRTLVPVDGFHHPFEDWIDQLARFLGVSIGEQLHRALQVGEQHRHLLALAFEGSLRGENPLGEVLGGVGLWGGERCVAATLPPTACPHSRQNSLLRGRSVPTLRAASGEPGAALRGRTSPEAGSRAGSGDTAYRALRSAKTSPVIRSRSRARAISLGARSKVGMRRSSTQESAIRQASPLRSSRRATLPYRESSGWPLTQDRLPRRLPTSVP